MLVGDEIKRIRLAKGMTTKALAEKTGLSVGFISNVERDINSPTISSLQKICDGLDTTIAELFSLANDGSIVYRHADCQRLVMPASDKTICDLFPLINRRLQPSYISMDPGGHYGDTAMSHEGEEVCLVVSGTIEFVAGTKKYTVEKGDCIYIESFVPHKMRNIGSSKAETVWVTLRNG